MCWDRYVELEADVVQPHQQDVSPQTIPVVLHPADPPEPALVA